MFTLLQNLKRIPGINAGKEDFGLEIMQSVCKINMTIDVISMSNKS